MRRSCVAAWWLAVFMLSGSANAQFFDIHYLTDYQARLTDTSGDPVVDGSYTVTFSIYDDDVAGSVRWTSGPRQVQTRGGLFTFLLGDSTNLDYGLFRTGVELWLGVKVGADPEMMPRTRLVGSPYSAVSMSLNGDVRTSRGTLMVGDAHSGGGSDSGVVIVTESKAVDHRGHVTILKISGGGSDTTQVLHIDGDPDRPIIQFGDGSEPDSGVVVTTGLKHKHRGHVTILKISNGGQDTTEVLSLDGDPESPSLQLGDGTGPDSGVIMAIERERASGLACGKRISNNGADTTDLFALRADISAPSLQFGDGSEPDSGVVVTTGLKHKHRGHVTILKISNGGQDTTEVLSLDGDPAAPSLQFGDGSESDSGVVVTTGKKHKHRGHVTILKISNGGQDTTGMVSIDGRSDTASVQLGGGSGGSIMMRTTSSQASGMLGVNTLTPGYEVDVVGTICATGGMCSPSDMRLKKDVEPLLGALTLVNTLRPVHFDWRTEEFPARRFPSGTQTGLIAQEVLRVFPEAVTQGSDGMYAVDYARLTPVLIGAIQEQQAQIDELRALLTELQNSLQDKPAASFGAR